MFRRLVKLAAFAAVVGVVVRRLAPDVARYLKIREM
jgi:hypothetical protein